MFETHKRYRLRRRQRFVQVFIGNIWCSLHRERTLCTQKGSRTWWEDVVLGTFDDNQWKENFRVSKSILKKVCKSLEPHLQKSSPVREASSPQHRLAVMLYFLATTAEYHTIGYLFGIHKSTVCVIVHEVCELINEMLFPTVVKFSEGNELRNIIDGFKNKCNFPNCAGAIDATHISIISPQEYHPNGINRKGW